tara:strand:- start:910 stop:1209 length:300 start_codon:yes stop_codon:yes gene_type:complete
MNRYSNTKIKMSKDGKRVYGTTYYPDIPLSDSDQLITTIVGARLDNIANTFYGDHTMWWIIAKANGIKGKTALEPGNILRIPGNVTSIIQKFRELNNLT